MIEKIVKTILDPILDLAGITLSEKQWETFMQFVKFGIVGVTNTLVFWVLNLAVLFLMSPLCLEWDYVIANITAFMISVLWSFYWNSRYVFDTSDENYSMWKALFKMYLSYGFTGFILNNLLSWLWISVLGLSKVIAPLLNSLVGVPVNYILNKVWAFRN